jgi:hypothetical protein
MKEKESECGDEAFAPRSFENVLFSEQEPAQICDCCYKPGIIL